MRVLITGGTGVIVGKSITPHLVEQDDVRVIGNEAGAPMNGAAISSKTKNQKLKTKQ